MPIKNAILRILPGCYVASGLLVTIVMAYIGLHDYQTMGWLFVGLLLLVNGIHLGSLNKAHEMASKSECTDIQSNDGRPLQTDWSTETVGT